MVQFGHVFLILSFRLLNNLDLIQSCVSYTSFRNSFFFFFDKLLTQSPVYLAGRRLENSTQGKAVQFVVSIALWVIGRTLDTNLKSLTNSYTNIIHLFSSQSQIAICKIFHGHSPVKLLQYYLYMCFRNYFTKIC